MADLSHSLPRPQVSSTLSKKVSNGNGFAAKNVYDDIFGGPPKFGLPTFSSRIEDYTEIFGGYHASSRGSTIPMLDLPDVDESSFLVDVRSSKFDYSEVFGGSGTIDFAIPYEELFAEAEGGESSSEDVWTPAGTGSPSEGSSEDPACAESNQALSNGNSHHSYESVKQVNTFCHKSNQMSKEDGISGTTHVTQLNAIPAFTLVVDEDIPAQKEKSTKSLHQVDNDHNFDVDACMGSKEGKHSRNANSDLAAFETVSRTSESNPRPQQNLNGDESQPERVFLTVSEINLRTRPSPIPPPSRPPPKLSIKQAESERPIASQLKMSRSHTSEGAAKDSSPTFFDVEIDASSSAAASAAAMKEAMEKAQARLKSAKLSMERKREGYQNRKVSGLKNDLKVKEKTENDPVNDAHRFKEEMSYRKFEKVGIEIEGFDRDERPEGSSAHVTPAFEPWFHNDSNKSLNQMPVNEYHEPHQQDGAGKQRSEKQLSEVVSTDKLKTVLRVPEQEQIGRKLMQGAKINKIEQNEEQAANMVCEQQEERKRKLKAAEEILGMEEHEKKVEVAEQIHQEEAAQNGTLQEECERRAKAAEMEVEHDKKLREASECLGYVNKENGACKQKEARTVLKEADEQEEHKRKWEQARELKNENQHNEPCQREVNEKIQRYEEENGKRVEESHEHEENERMLKKIPELKGSERKQVAWERENSEKNLKEAFGCGREEHDRRGKKIHKEEENEKWRKELNGREENLKKLQEFNEEGENEKRLMELCEKEESEKRRKVCEEENEKLKELQEQKENEKKQEEVHKNEEKETKLKVVQDQEENDKTQKETLGLTEIARRETSEKEDNEKRVAEVLDLEESHSRQHDVSEENGTKLKASQDASACREEKNLNPVTEFCISDESKEKLMASNQTCILGEVNVLKATSETHKQVEENNKLKATQELHVHEESGNANGTVEHDFEQKENEKELKEVEVTIEQEKNVYLEAMHVVQSACDLNASENKNKADLNLEFDQNEKKLQGVKEATGENEDEKNKNVKENDLVDEDSKETLKTGQNARQGDENGKKRNAAWQDHILEEKGDRSNFIKDINMRQNVEMETNSSEVPKMVERIKDERMEREKEQEMERLRKIEEDREREREREKDRMAVERITREARERAFAEARERAERAAVERATAEARQRAMAEVRERLEKASVEARLRAERAAVERATAEAQERAMEKAMAGKAALGAKERVERSVSEKFATTCRDTGMRQSVSFSDLRDTQYQSSSSFNGSQRHPDSSTHVFAADKSQGAEAESAQRCKARLERHQRTVQRAAKALAEKNMRDLLAQREQAERNKLAETLDADVKRWSSGKEGNLRALLSTLQYILGSESGWQPVPLTDVITAVAVKKAYRKATLCVHPDKLQQRGASIQQKYICEKVFDLLKEAWNKFNSEER